MVNLDATLDLDGADADQIDLFYLVDCVLDEVEQVKLAARGSDESDTDDQKMPIASPNFYDTELMEHLETPLHDYGESDQSFDGQGGYIPSTHTQISDSMINADNIPRLHFDYLTYMAGIESTTDNSYQYHSDIPATNHNLENTSKASSADSLYELGNDPLIEILDSVANSGSAALVTDTETSYVLSDSVVNDVSYSESGKDDTTNISTSSIVTSPNTSAILDTSISHTDTTNTSFSYVNPYTCTAINKDEAAETAATFVPAHRLEDRLQREELVRKATLPENSDAYNATCDNLYTLPNVSYDYSDKHTSYAGYGPRRTANYAELQQYADITSVPVSAIPQTSTHQHMSLEQATSTIQHPTCYDEESNDTVCTEFVSWATKHPEHWNSAEVLDWLYYTADKNNLDSSLLRGESFRGVTGSDLCKMSPEQFCMLDASYGQFFYNVIRQIVTGLPSQSAYMNHPKPETSYTFNTPVHGDFHGDGATSPSHDAGERSPYHSPEVQHSYQQNVSYTYDPQSTSKPEAVESLLLPGYECGMISPSDLKYEQSATTGFYSHPYYIATAPAQRRTQSEAAAKRAKLVAGVPRRRPGRPRIKSLPTEEELRIQREKRMKSQHLWEFIHDMLTTPNYNPSVLKWENEKEGVFRFVQSEIVATLWGALKNNDQMTYEKLSRAMRHYYKRGILERVEGRRLVYKFTQPILERMRLKNANKETQSMAIDPNSLLLQNAGFPKPESYTFFTSCLTK